MALTIRPGVLHSDSATEHFFHSLCLSIQTNGNSSLIFPLKYSIGVVCSLAFWFPLTHKMEIDYSDTSNWLFDYGLVEDISVPANPFPAPVSAIFSWGPQPLLCSFNTRLDSVLPLSFLIILFDYQESERK